MYGPPDQNVATHKAINNGTKLIKMDVGVGGDIDEADGEAEDLRIDLGIGQDEGHRGSRLVGAGVGDAPTCVKPPVAPGGRAAHIGGKAQPMRGPAMQTRDKFFDDISQLMTNAAGMAQGMKTEAETAMKGWMERWLAESDLVAREEFDAVREMAVKAREENERLGARLAELEAELAKGK